MVHKSVQQALDHGIGSTEIHIVEPLSVDFVRRQIVGTHCFDNHRTLMDRSDAGSNVGRQQLHLNGNYMWRNVERRTMEEMI